ncbi:twin-arginine translocation signal domain-containing protein [Bradyrhizobium sp. 159]|uniref:twin-arginine translocation signal domain-containing protein n=1 Tax=Bradyrhizobium sp. 159 TaxID=2782632 RepID=UPI001FF829AB|nr:twin-arginine translocation signal domain-containing protein [Bradyrhizobium sp. 159]MCK1618929.1 twin-arginine translocation signal domain-containing protein [Bradyrhizobium sp. 159]
MTRADRVHSTPPLNSSSNKVARTTTVDPVETSRRQFLAQAAAVTAGGVALGAALPLPGSASAAGLAPDPIFAAIEAHKAAYAAYGAAIDHNGAVADSLPVDKRRSNANRWDEEIYETDDPRWIESEREVMRTCLEADRIAIELLSIMPTTMAGLIAIVEYAVVHDVDGIHWPDCLDDDETTSRQRSWQHFFLQNVVLQALQEGVVA